MLQQLVRQQIAWSNMESGTVCVITCGSPCCKTEAVRTHDLAVCPCRHVTPRVWPLQAGSCWVSHQAGGLCTPGGRARGTPGTPLGGACQTGLVVPVPQPRWAATQLAFTDSKYHSALPETPCFVVDDCVLMALKRPSGTKVPAVAHPSFGLCPNDFNLLAAISYTV